MNGLDLAAVQYWRRAAMPVLATQRQGSRITDSSPRASGLWLLVLPFWLLLAEARAVAQPMSPGGEETSLVFLPLIPKEHRILARRLGYGATATSLSHYGELNSLNAGWYIDWSAAPGELPDGIEHVKVIRVHQKLSCGEWYHSDRNVCPYVQPLAYVYSPDAEVIKATAQASPGALWLIGNEMDRKDWAYCLHWDGTFCEEVAYSGQDEMLPETYAIAFHELAALVREADASAQIGIGGVIQATPVRLDYLTKVWDSHLQLYGEPMAVDVWNVHNFILQEQENNWGADMPPGSGESQGQYIGDPATHIDLTIFDQQIRAFRQWMKARGQQEKPLIVSEYGVLYHNETLGLAPNDPAPIYGFMLDTLAYFLHTKDCDLGRIADDCRLVQRWNWYSLDDAAGAFNPHSRLVDPDSGQITPTGERFRDFAREHLSLLALRGY